MIRRMTADGPHLMHRPDPAATRRVRRSGFTLVELLVVIGIISLLMAILLPVLSRVRYQAQLTDCSVHLHQIGIAVLAYANDNKGWYPRRQCNTVVGYDEPWWLVSEPGGNQKDDRDLFRPYVQTVNYLRCPLAPEEIDLEFNHDGRAILGGYELWFGTQMVRGDAQTRMFKVNERPRYKGRRFRVLAADIERVAYFFNKVNSGHPDFRHLKPQVSAPSNNYFWDPVVAMSLYHNTSG